MTTETTATEASMTPEQFAEDFIKNHSVTELVDQFVMYSKSVDSLNENLELSRGSVYAVRNELNQVINKVTEFLKSHIGENDDATVDELKELAEALNIEMTRNITVTFRAEVEVNMTVPIDFDEDKIDEYKFTVSAEFNGMDDVDVDDTSIEIENFEVEED